MNTLTTTSTTATTAGGTPAIAPAGTPSAGATDNIHNNKTTTKSNNQQYNNNNINNTNTHKKHHFKNKKDQSNNNNSNSNTNTNTNTQRNTFRDNNNSNRNNYRNKNKQQLNNNNNNNNFYQDHHHQQQQEEEFDQELQLAFELSKLEFKKETEKNNNNNSDPPVSSYPPLSSSSSSTSSTFNTNEVFDKMKTKKKNTIDMTHLIQFKPRNPVNYQQQQQQGFRNDRNDNRYNNNNNNYNNHYHHHNNNHHHHHHHNNKQKPNKKKDSDIERRSTFLQANYLFKINPVGNYTSALKSSDHFVVWNKVEQVLYPTETEFLCPICFDPPFAPKITKCGHVTCYSCILRNLQHTDKCPLCLVPILKEDLKSVQFKMIKKYNEGDKIKFQLLRYNHETNVPFLSNQSIPNKITFPASDEPNAPFSRFSIVDNIDDIIEKELEEIYRAQAIADSEHEIETVVSLAEAERDILERQKNFIKLMESKQHSDEKNYITISSPTNQKLQHHEFDSYQCSNNFEIRIALENYYNSVDSPSSSISEDDSFDYNSVGTNSSGGQSTPPIVNNDINNNIIKPTTTTTSTSTTTTNNNNNNNNIKSNTNITPISNLTYENQPFESIYYLYQSNDGQDIYLHPLCMKILDKEFKEGNNLPSLLESNIIELETFEVTKKSRHLFKVLNMVTLTSSITFAEIDLTNIVSKSTLSEFAQQLKQRKDIRLKKKRDEEKKLKIKEKERLNDIKRSKELTQIYKKEKEAEAEKEKQRLEELRLEDEERAKNQSLSSSSSKVVKTPNFLEAIQSHKNIDSIKEFPTLH